MLLASRRLRLASPFLIAAVGLVAAWVMSVGFSGYFVYLAIGMVTASIATIGLGVVTGSAGIIALCQLTFAAIGAWVVCWMNVSEAPGGFIVWLLAGGAVAALAGVLIGLPALRLRGVNLAVVTLGFAAAFDVLIVQTQFPGQVDGVSVQRPEGFTNDRSYFFFAMIVLIIAALIVSLLQRSRIGSSWKAVAFSERSTAAVGQSVALAKLSAFAVSAALGGISGGLLAGQVGLPYAASFTPIQSLGLYILAVMSGAYLIDMAIFAGITWVLLPELLRVWGIKQDWGLVVFGFFGIQALAGGGNLGEAVRGLFTRLSKRRSVAAEGAPTDDRGETVSTSALDVFAVAEAAKPLPPNAGPVLEVWDLGVSFGALKALDG